MKEKSSKMREGFMVIPFSDIEVVEKKLLPTPTSSMGNIKK